MGPNGHGFRSGLSGKHRHPVGARHEARLECIKRPNGHNV